ncbi:gliding motility protein, partial [Corallococcus sp. CA047B]
MRIVCQKCAAAYAIDDRLISAKGVRAQCPRCRHLQLVKREASAASVTASTPEGAAVPAPEPKRPPGAPAPPVAREPRSNPAAAKAPDAPAASDLFGDLGSMPELGPPRDEDPFADLGPPASRAPAPANLSADPFADLGPPDAAPARSEPSARPAAPAPAQRPAPTAAASAPTQPPAKPAPTAAAPARKEPVAKPPTPSEPAPSLALPADPLLDFLGPPPSDLG